jgi:hypothetical protein
MQPAVDDEGSILQPLPRVHRLLAAPRCLPHVCQVGAAWRSAPAFDRQIAPPAPPPHALSGSAELLPLPPGLAA